MKIKDLERTGNVAWSPGSYTPISLAVGTAAQQLDAAFMGSGEAVLEVYSLNLDDPGQDLKLEVSAACNQRFHSLVWGSQGCIVGGCDDGLIEVYNVDNLVKSSGVNALETKLDGHGGHVRTLDFNSFQGNLLASGASESEIYIWDLNSPNKPMSPGSKSQPFEDVLSVAWNKQVQHILASTLASKCVIWDLRKEHPIIKLTDSVARVRWKAVAWHPNVATQLCLASEEDHSPVVQLWDLRFATAPIRTMEHHERGILSLAWCQQDCDLLISSAKDNRIVCVNPNSSTASDLELAEIAKTTQWSFDVRWCPRDPHLIVCPSHEGHISVYTLMGGKIMHVQTTNKIADSFPGMQAPNDATLGQQQAQNQQRHEIVSTDLKKAPCWLRRPVCVSFGFGGKLLWIENNMHSNNQAGGNQQQQSHTLYIGQVFSEPDLVQKSLELEEALAAGNFIEYCTNKANSLDDPHQQQVWKFLRAHFSDNSHLELLSLLGYNVDDVTNQLNEFIGNNRALTKFERNSSDQINNDVEGETHDETNIIENDFIDLKISSKKKPSSPLKIRTTNDMEGFITKALLLGNVEEAVELCFKSKRFADAIIISMTGGSNLLARAQRAYLEQCTDYVSTLISALANEDWESIVNNCELSSWKEALAAILTHWNDSARLSTLCEQLGDRLVQNKEFQESAHLCYICAGSFNKLVNSWTENQSLGSLYQASEKLQELIELVNFMQKSVECQGQQVKICGALSELYLYYASMLSSQGRLQTALNYLNNCNSIGDTVDSELGQLKERVSTALGISAPMYGAANNRSQSYPNSYHGKQPPSQSGGMVQPPLVPSRTTTANQAFRRPSATHAPVFSTGLPSGTMAPSLQWPTQTQPPQSQPGPIMQIGNTMPSVPPRLPSVGQQTTTNIGLPPRKYVMDPSVNLMHGGTMGGTASGPPTAYPSRQITPPITNQPPLMSLGQNNYVNNSMGLPPPPPTSMQVNAVTPSIQPAQSGWNDPPVFSRPLKPSQRASNVAPPSGVPAPITHPLFNNAPTSGNAMNIPTLPVSISGAAGGMMVSNPVSHPPLPTDQLAGQPPRAPYPMQNTLPQAITPSIPPVPVARPTVAPNWTQAPPESSANMQPFAVNSMNSGTPVMPMQPKIIGEATSAIPNNTSNSIKSETSKQIVQQNTEERRPIPEEHVHMQTVFDELRSQCACAAPTAQMRRKFDDVGKKLDVLYDLLRDNKLSNNTLTALHQMVQCIQNGDYNGGLNVHMQLVTGSDFSQISGFMPALKMLLQSAIQLQIYVR